MKTIRNTTLLISVVLAAAACLLLAQSPAPAPAGFDRDVRPVITSTCAGCHNASLASGGLNLVALNSAATVAALAGRRTDFLPGEALEPVYLRETSFVKAPAGRGREFPESFTH